MIVVTIAAMVLGSGVPHELHVWVARDVAPGKNVQVNINTRNITSVTVEALPVDGLDWLSREHRDEVYPEPIGSATYRWALKTVQQGRAGQGDDNYYTRQTNLPINVPGVYLLRLSGGGCEEHAVVNVTNLAVVAKASPYKEMVWVTDHKSGAVVPNVGVNMFSSRGDRLAQGLTGGDGTILMAAKPRQRFLVIRRGRDLAGLRITPPNYDGSLNAYWQTDRPIYRPGQTVDYKAIIRLTHGQGYDVVTNQDVRVTLKDPRDSPIDAVTLRPNENGSVFGSFSIPQEGMLGNYTLQLEVEHRQSRQSISVAAYRKPEFQVTLTPISNHYLSGQVAQFKLHASYYFGAPLPQAMVNWIGRSSWLPYQDPENTQSWFYGGDGNLYPRDTESRQPFVGEGQTATDKNGDAVIELKTDPNAPDRSYSIQATVIDATHRQVQADSSVPVYASSYRVSLTPEIQAVAVGGLIPVRLSCSDLDRRPVSTTVRLRVITTQLDEKTNEEKEVVLTETKLKLPANGHGTTNLPALADGDLILEAMVTDPTGRQSTNRTSVWVAGLRYKAPKEKEAPSISLRLDKHVYEPGQTVKAFVTDNTPSRPVLIVAEGLDIWSYEVKQGGSIAYQIKTDERMSPDAYVSVSQWVNGNELTAEQQAPLPDMDRLLNVIVEPNKQSYEPGDMATYQIFVSNSSGRRQNAEISLSVVDEAIYSLSPDSNADPYRQYWGARQNGVVSLASSPQEVSGGAYQRANGGKPTVRSRFEDTAYWSPIVTVNSYGIGSASFEMPGNLTTWRATARAFTGTTSVGVGKASVLATRPLTLRLALPRQLTLGDKLAVTGTVNNRTARTASVKVDLNAQGVQLENGSAQTVEVPANGQATVKWTVSSSSFPESGEAVFQAEAIAAGGAPDMNDALKVSLPVIPRGFRTTASIGGVLSSSSEATLNIPSEAAPKGAVFTARVYMGVSPAINAAAEEVFPTRYGSPAAANILMTASAVGPAAHAEDIREALALLSRDMAGAGWGWWAGMAPDPVITAQVGHAIAIAGQNGIVVPQFLRDSAVQGGGALYNQSQLWEHRALLASSLMELGSADGEREVEEARAQANFESPFSRLRIAEALAGKDRDAAAEELEPILKLVSNGSYSAYVPTGDGIGWTADSAATTAELLVMLSKLDRDHELQGQLVRWLVSPDRGWQCSGDDEALIARALSMYRQHHPDASDVGTVKLTVGGRSYDLKRSTVDASASVRINDLTLSPGDLKFRFERSGSGEALYSVQGSFYRKADYESQTGLRVTRRFEVRTPAGIWKEVDRPVLAGEPVRVTVALWGDDISDAVRVDEPLPAGFEFVDGDISQSAREEVRDSEVVHYVSNAGTPLVMRYYLRSEAGGTVAANPASAQYLRRPEVAGHGRTELFEVKG